MAKNSERGILWMDEEEEEHKLESDFHAASQHDLKVGAQLFDKLAVELGKTNVLEHLSVSGSIFDSWVNGVRVPSHEAWQDVVELLQAIDRDKFKIKSDPNYVLPENIEDPFLSSQVDKTEALETLRKENPFFADIAEKIFEYNREGKRLNASQIARDLGAGVTRRRVADNMNKALKSLEIIMNRSPKSRTE